MNQYKKVRGGFDIAKRCFDLLNDVDSHTFNNMNRPYIIQDINDSLHGRESPLNNLVERMQNTCAAKFPDQVKALCRDIRDFQAQRQLIETTPYTKSSSKTYKYRYFDYTPETPRKVIDQRIYDDAVKNGFPPDFFRGSYFDGVNIYCLPDNTDFSFSYFDNCRIVACRIIGGRFDGTNFYGTDIQTAKIDHCTFFYANIVHTRFNDCHLTAVSYQNARLKHCSFTDCHIDANFLAATLDCCQFGRITTNGCRNLDTATITMGGATSHECQRNRDSIYTALGYSGAPSEPPAPIRPQKRGPREPER